VQYSELEDKIPGLKDGMFKSPKDGKWKKVKSISRVPGTGTSDNGDEDINEAETKTGVDITVSKKITDVKKLKSLKKIKSMKKIKSIVKIDDDLADKMKKEVLAAEGGPKPGPDPELDQDRLQGLQSKVDRILEMFNATSLDDIISAIPIDSRPRSIEIGEGTIKKPSSNHPSVGAIKGQAALDRENMRVRDLEGGLEGQVTELQRDAAELERAREMQEVLARMLQVQLDKVDKIKELIEDYKAKEIALRQLVKDESEGIKEAKDKVLEHLDILKLLANNVRDEEMARLDKYTNPILPEIFDNYPARGGSVMNKLGNYLDKPNMQIGKYPLKYANTINSIKKINSMRKINSIKKIRSMTGLTEDQAKRLLGWQRERDSHLLRQRERDRGIGRETANY
jgi:hypothetical protein